MVDLPHSATGPAVLPSRRIDLCQELPIDQGLPRRGGPRRRNERIAGVCRAQPSGRHRAHCGGGVAVLLGAALMGVLIGRRFGASASTDGFFVANALYGVFIILAQSLRMTVVPRLVDGDTGVRFHTELRGIALVFAGSGALFAAWAPGWPRLSRAATPSARSRSRSSCSGPRSGFTSSRVSARPCSRPGTTIASPRSPLRPAPSRTLPGFSRSPLRLGVYGIPAALSVGAAVSAGLIALALRRNGRRTRRAGAQRP